jgi:hypothetical protein
MEKRNEIIADLLMGAAYADNHLDGRELQTVKELLAKVMRVEQLPAQMEGRLSAFKPEGFDPAAAAKSLELSDEETKRHLIELIAAVHEADEEIDFDENVYLETVAYALEMARNTFSDLSLEISIEDLQEAGDSLLKI